MKIHSSSLTYSSAGLNKPHPDTSVGIKNKVRELNSVKSDQYQTDKVKLAPHQLEKKLAQTERSGFEPSNKNPVNLHIQKALNAYTDTENQSFHEQRSQLTSIDLFI